METQGNFNKFFNLAYCSLILPYLGKVDEGAAVMTQLCCRSRKTWLENLDRFVEYIESKPGLYINDYLPLESLDRLLTVPPVYFWMEVSLKDINRGAKFFEYLEVISEKKKEGHPEFQHLNIKNKFILCGINKIKYQRMLDILINEFGITFSQFRELNKDSNEHVNLYERGPVKENRLYHGFHYIRMIVLANYEYFIKDSNRIKFEMTQILGPIGYKLPTAVFLRPKKGDKAAEKAITRNKFERAGYLSFSETNVPNSHVKYILENLITNVNCLSIPPFEYLKELQISETIQDHCEELELVGFIVELPKGNYLR